MFCTAFKGWLASFACLWGTQCFMLCTVFKGICTLVIFFFAKRQLVYVHHIPQLPNSFPGIWGPLSFMIFFAVHKCSWRFIKVVQMQYICSTDVWIRHLIGWGVMGRQNQYELATCLSTIVDFIRVRVWVPVETFQGGALFASNSDWDGEIRQIRSHAATQWGRERCKRHRLYEPSFHTCQKASANLLDDSAW